MEILSGRLVRFALAGSCKCVLWEFRPFNQVRGGSTPALDVKNHLQLTERSTSMLYRR